MVTVASGSGPRDVRWRLYYGNGDRTFCNLDGPPQAAPARDVQALAQVADITIGRRTCSGYDYYWFEDGEWFGGDIFGLYDYLDRSGVVKFGRAISRKDFESALKKAVTDPDLLPKVAWDSRERKPSDESS